MSIQILLNVLGSTDGASAITEERIRAPDEALLLHIYNVLLTIPSLRDAITLHETQQKENERRKVDMESQLHEAERLKAEAETRAEEDRIAKEQAIKEKVEINGQLAQVQGTLAALQSTSDSGIQQSAEVKGRLEQAEQEKRDVLEMLEREKIESSRRSEEIESLTLRNRESRTEINRLSSELQESKSAEGSGKFKIQSLEQELTLKTNDAKWAHQELTKSTEELTQHRVRSNGEISSLTLQLQQKTQALEASETKITSLQSAYDSTLARLDEATREKSELRQRLVEQEGAFKSEMGTQQRLSALMEQQKDNAERRLADIEEQWEQVLAQHADREQALRQDIANQQEERDEIIREKEEIQQALDRLAESVGIDTNGYQIGATNGDETASVVSTSTPKRPAFHLPDNSAVMSPTAALAAKVQKSGKSFTQIYADLARSEEELRREKTENRRLVGVLEQVMADLHDRAPALQAQREEKEQLEQHAEELSTALANACQERDYSEHEAKQQRLRADATHQENVLLNQQVTDLARQVRDLTREILIRDDPTSAERLEADGTQLGDSTTATTSTISDTQAVITEQLVTFRSLNELITQNSRLLRVVRQLGTEMEARESKYRSDFEMQESDAIDEAKAVITRLQEDLRAERTRSEGVRRERDMFRAMTAQGGGIGRSVSGTIQGGSGNVESSSAAHVTLTNQYSQLQAQFEAFRSERRSIPSA
jgi:nucleoprotein TPR